LDRTILTGNIAWHRLKKAIGAGNEKPSPADRNVPQILIEWIDVQYKAEEFDEERSPMVTELYYHSERILGRLG
jgi:hypothetical protein